MIKIAISGQIDNDTKVGYSYPHKFDPARPTPEDEWLHSVTDPRNAREFGAEEIFALWKSEHGNYYAIIFPSKDDPRNGRMMITVFVGQRTITDGNIILSVLRELKTLIDQTWPNMDDSSVRNIVSPLETCLSKVWSAVSSATTNVKAYRVYQEKSDLIDILQYPNQVEYNPYKRVLIVPASCLDSAAQAIVNYKEISGQIKVLYDISRPYPEGVLPDRIHYNHGDTVTVTCSKHGYKPENRTFVANGLNNKYARFLGTEIILNSLEAMGIQFVRAIRFNVFSKKGKSISDSTIVEGLNCVVKKDSSNPNVRVFEGEMQEYQVRVSSSGFTPQEIILTDANFIEGSIRVTLDPILNELKVRIEKNERPFEGIIQIYSDDPLYPILLEMQGQNRKLYTSQKINHISSNSDNLKKRDRANDTMNGVANKYRKEEPHKGFLSEIWAWLKIPVIFIVIAYILYLIIALYNDETPWPFPDSKPERLKVDVAAPAEAVSNDTLIIKEVLQYMKDNDIWERPQMESSSEYVIILDYISNYQIDNVINHPYSTQTIVPCNGYWKGGKSSFVDIVNSLKQRGNYEHEIKPNVEDAMRRCSDGNKVDLEKLVNEVVAIQKKYESSVTSSQSTSNVNKKSTTSNVETSHNSTGKPDSDTFDN